jgi:hypothetical protein
VRADYRKFKVKSKPPDFEREEPERFYRRKLEDISRINPALAGLKLPLIKEAGTKY